uniref:Uncharacterized protein n=1 Tax=Anguilla anguilla TaxID=7936 RepID=A0A0E9TBI5_ANGAN
MCVCVYDVHIWSCIALYYSVKLPPFFCLCTKRVMAELATAVPAPEKGFTSHCVLPV